MSFLFGRGKSIPRNATFQVTQLGRDKLSEYTGDQKSQVLMALETGGTQNVAEIATKSGLSRGKVERLVSALAQGGYVQLLSRSAMDEEDM